MLPGGQAVGPDALGRELVGEALRVVDDRRLHGAVGLRRSPPRGRTRWRWSRSRPPRCVPGTAARRRSPGEPCPSGPRRSSRASWPPSSRYGQRAHIWPPRCRGRSSSAAAVSATHCRTPASSETSTQRPVTMLPRWSSLRPPGPRRPPSGRRTRRQAPQPRERSRDGPLSMPLVPPVTRARNPFGPRVHLLPPRHLQSNRIIPNEACADVPGPPGRLVGHLLAASPAGGPGQLSSRW